MPRCPCRARFMGLGLNLGITESSFRTQPSKVLLCNTPQMRSGRPRGTAHDNLLCSITGHLNIASTDSQPASASWQAGKRQAALALQRFAIPTQLAASSSRPATGCTQACGDPRLYSLTSGSPGCPNVRRSASGLVGPCSQADFLDTAVDAPVYPRESLLD